LILKIEYLAVRRGKIVIKVNPIQKGLEIEHWKWYAGTLALRAWDAPKRPKDLTTLKKQTRV